MVRAHVQFARMLEVVVDEARDGARLPEVRVVRVVEVVPVYPKTQVGVEQDLVHLSQVRDGVEVRVIVRVVGVVADEALSGAAASHQREVGRLGPAWRDCVHSSAGRNSHDLVLQAQHQSDEDCGLGGGVVCVAGFAEDPRRRSDQDERAAAVPLHLTEKAARGQERRRQVPVDRRAPPVERQLPQRPILARPDAGDRRANVHLAERLARGGKEAFDVVFDRQVRL